MSTEPQDTLPWRLRWSLLLGRLTVLHTPAERQELLHRLSQLSQTDGPRVLAFVNAHAMNGVAAHTPQAQAFFSDLLAADVLLRDGSGMATLLRGLGRAPGLNLNGTDLLGPLLAGFNGRPVALWGTREPYLQRAHQAVLADWVPDSRVTLTDGFRPVVDYLALAAQERPALIVLGMGMPRQEQVALALRAQLQHLGQPCLVVCGGAIIDFWGGRTPRAPLWLRRLGLEWLFRLVHEPRRLFTRYVLGNPAFLTRAWRLRQSQANKR